MTTDEALQFLRAHQPLPSTEEISEELLKQFDEVREHFAVHPDNRSVPLLLNSFGEGDGHGVYQLVEDTILVHPDDVIIPALLAGLSSPYSSVRAWNAEIAANYPRSELVMSLAELLRHGSINECIPAAIALAIIDTSEARLVLRRALESNLNDETKEAIRETLGN